ncbi:hypothetical protein [Aquimarina sp. 2201CG14-23]|uniref:hypothetical protein n=1 Tax=Aquimarina mycalae TaxID=3040073 RepID=UPI002477EF57|nr:hypothetical protein [Aquimarina sp. 2201CG14-23]MDH7446844.1 hypothetical protein [Aquimarina sp. 2201CG14-23]
MKKLFLLLISLTIVSCDDGDIIVTSFEFDDVDLQLCKGSATDEFVFFKINTSINEAISYNFIDAEYSDTIPTTTPITFELSNTDNGFTYRQFNNTITADYYCSNIPDSNIIVTEELIGVSGQTEIINEIVNEDDNDGVASALEAPDMIEPDEDMDNDGVPNYLDDEIDDPMIGDVNNMIEDGYNHDDDNIPSFKDQDDDNDNVLTSVELPNNDPNDESFLDTDGDNIPNYIDEDDDGDGILTRNEDFDGNGNPRDDDYDNDGIANFLDDDDDDDGILTINEDANNDGDPTNDDSDGDMIPDYLDTDNDSDENNPNADVPSSLDNTVITTFRTTLSITDIILNEVNDQFEDKNFSFGFRDEIIPKTTKKN